MHFSKKIIAFLFSAVFLIQFSFCKKYESKYFLWRNVKGMETQIRDTILYFCPANSENQIEQSNLKPAVIICPGGSYNHLGMDTEGFTVAKWFNSIGINAFVLRYRVGYNEHHYPDQLQDFQMAIHFIRKNSSLFGTDKNKIGAIGFSAGGHLVTMAGEFEQTHNELKNLAIPLSESLRPDFIMSIYPVVTMDDDIGHKWSRKSLLGHVWDERASEKFSLFNLRGFKYSQKYKDEFSMEKNVPDNMPPVFLLACRDDPIVIFENSVRLDKALTQKNIPHKFVIYEKGGHGFGMKESSFIMKNHHWNEKDLLPWLKEIKIIE